MADKSVNIPYVIKQDNFIAVSNKFHDFWETLICTVCNLYNWFGKGNYIFYKKVKHNIVE